MPSADFACAAGCPRAITRSGSPRGGRGWGGFVARRARRGARGRARVRGGSPSRDYAIWLASRRPELADFHRAASAPLPTRHDVVIGLARRMERQRREQVEWLSRVAGVTLRDEGRIDQTAADIAAGTL